MRVLVGPSTLVRVLVGSSTFRQAMRQRRYWPMTRCTRARAAGGALLALTSAMDARRCIPCKKSILRRSVASLLRSGCSVARGRIIRIIMCDNLCIQHDDIDNYNATLRTTTRQVSYTRRTQTECTADDATSTHISDNRVALLVAGTGSR